MKPHEETWRAEGYVLVAEVDGAERGIAEFTYRDKNNGRYSRTEFASHAPPMYRALVQVLNLAKDVGKGGDPEAIIEAIVGVARQTIRVVDRGMNHGQGGDDGTRRELHGGTEVLEGGAAEGAGPASAG